MHYKILTENSVDNTNIDGARDHYFNAGGRDGIVKGSLNEGTFATLASNVISLNTCVLLVSGHPIVIDEAWNQSFSSIPSSSTRYAVVAQIIVDENQNVTFDIVVQSASTPLIKNNLFKNLNGAGTYQVEIGRFTLTTLGTITDVVRTLDTITGGSSGMGEHFITGDITTTMLDAGMDANVTAEDVYTANGDYEKTNFSFEFPATAGTVVKVNNVEQANLDFTSDPQTQLNGKADASNVYTKTETDTLLSDKADTSTLDDYVTKATIQEISGAKTFTGDNTYKTSGATYGAKIPDTTEWTSNKTIAMTDLLPVGSLIGYAGSTAPTNYLLCDGSTFSQSTYPELYTVLGSTTLPDLRGRVVLGADTNYTLGSTGGSEKHTHEYGLQVGNFYQAGVVSVGGVATYTTNNTKSYSGFSVTGRVTGNMPNLSEQTNREVNDAVSTGNVSYTSNMQPYGVYNYIIKAK